MKITIEQSFELSEDAVQLLKDISKAGFAEYRDNEYVCWNDYKDKKTSGGFRVRGYTDTKTCSCYYDSAFRYYTQSEPDEDCEKCQGTGDEPVYRQGLNDCVLLAETVTEYKKARLQQKIKTLQERLSKYE